METFLFIAVMVLFIMAAVALVRASDNEDDIETLSSKAHRMNFKYNDMVDAHNKLKSEFINFVTHFNSDTITNLEKLTDLVELHDEYIQDTIETEMDKAFENIAEKVANSQMKEDWEAASLAFTPGEDEIIKLLKKNKKK